MIKRAHIRQFLAVVDAGGFTQAALRIRVTQPALSAGIAELERLVGTRLFLRNRRQIRLTEAGGAFCRLRAISTVVFAPRTISVVPANGPRPS